MLSQLLLQPVPQPSVRGRLVKFDLEEPEISLSTGPLDERIAGLMRQRGYPMTAREIAAGIGSNASQVHRGLKLLIAARRVEVIEISGSVREYVLR